MLNAKPDGHCDAIGSPTMRASLTLKILAGFAVPLLVVLAVIAVMEHALLNFAESAEWVDHTDRAIALAHELDSTVAVADSASLGFILTGKEDFFRQYTEARGDFGRLFRELRRHVSDNPPQVARLERADGLFLSWDREVASPLMAIRRTKTGEALAAALSERVSPGAIAELRAVMTSVIDVERNLLLPRTARNDRALRTGQLGALLGGLVAVATAGGIAAALARNVAKRVNGVAMAAERVARGELSARSGVSGRDEVATMAAAFDQMAGYLEHRSSMQQKLRELGGLLQACGTTEEAQAVAARLVPTLFAGVRGALLTISPSRNALSEVVRWGGSGEERSVVGEPDDCWAIRRGRLHSIDDTSAGLCCKHLPDSPPKSYACVPLLAQGDIIGAMYLALALPERSEGAQLAETIADQLGLTLGNLRLQERLRNQSIRDPMTGLFNRRYLEETIVRELSRAARTERPIGIVMIDVDHFKRFNDTHGHFAGDAVLRELAALLRSEFRTSDFACRYGGEEFVLVLVDSGLSDSARRADMLRDKVKGLRVIDRGLPLGSVTLSLGVASYPEHGADSETLLRAADDALYRAKVGGRDRVELALASAEEIVPRSRAQRDTIA